MSGKVGPEFDHWSDLQLWLLLVVQDLIHLVNHCYQAVGWPGVIEYGGIGHRLPKDQSFTLCAIVKSNRETASWCHFHFILFGTIRGCPLSYDCTTLDSHNRLTAVKKHVCLPWLSPFSSSE